MSIKKSKQIALFVDLDGTLITGDTLHQSVILLIKRYPLKIFSLFCWITKGRAFLKYKVAQLIIPEPSLLQYKKDVIGYINKEKNNGRDVYLLSAANKKIAESVAGYLGIFKKVYGSTAKINLLGKEKLKRIRNIVGNNQFEYMGDSKNDIPIWSATSSGAAIDPNRGLKKRIRKFDNIKMINTMKKKAIFKSIIKEIRIHQWAKNLLLFLPIIMAHQFTETKIVISVFWAFISFSFCASAMYVLNDLLDIETDIAHPSKQHRPLASGEMSIKLGVFLIIGLIIISFSIVVSTLSTSFLIILIIYIMLTTAYSFILKQIMLIDVIVLGGLYTLRIGAGSVASGVGVSSWLLVFSMFFFLSLAFMKRYADLILMRENNKGKIAGRDYHLEDLDLVQKSGITSGFVAMLVLALYINSAHVIGLYKSPILIWFTVPVLLYWLMRMWMVTNRGKMTEDPIIFALRDKITYISMFIIVVIMLLAAIIDNSMFNNLNIIQ